MILWAGAPSIVGFLATWFYFEEPALRSQMKVPVLSIFASYSTLLVHELIGVLFTSQKDRPILAGLISLLLPLTKFGFRILQMRLLRNSKHEGLGTIVSVFEVELFNSLYMSVFLEKVTSAFNIVLLIMVDVLENAFFLIYTHRQALKLRHGCSSEEKEVLVRQLLFQTELAVLIEFTEVLTPLIYGVWITGVQFTPNKAWIKGLQDTDVSYYYNDMNNLGLLMLLELALLMLLMGVLFQQHQLPLFRQLHYTLNVYSPDVLSLMCT